MIEISTPTSNSNCETKTASETDMQEIPEPENSFYELIKPALNQLKKEPTDESIQKIMAFSKSV